MPRKTIAKCAKEIMVQQNKTYIWAGDPNLCLDIAEQAGSKARHPLNRIKSVIDALRRSPDFVQFGYIRACDATGRREISHPVFELNGK